MVLGGVLEQVGFGLVVLARVEGVGIPEVFLVVGGV